MEQRPQTSEVQIRSEEGWTPCFGDVVTQEIYSAYTEVEFVKRFCSTDLQARLEVAHKQSAEDTYVEQKTEQERLDEKLAKVARAHEEREKQGFTPFVNTAGKTPIVQKSKSKRPSKSVRKARKRAAKVKDI